MSDREEKRYRRIGWISSLVVQLALLVLFYFFVAWKEPFPPIPSYGIELNFGLERPGSGKEPVSTSVPQKQPAEEPLEEVKEPLEAEEAPVEEEVVEDVENTEFQDEVLEESSEVEAPEDQVAAETPGPDVVESGNETVTDAEKKPAEEKKPQQKTEAEEEASKQAETTTTSQPDSPPQETVSASEGRSATDKGDEGKKEGTLDGRALMGEQKGESEGASLHMAGWTWDFKPAPKDESAEYGRIVYKIKIDDEGYLIDIELVSSTVSPVVERLYRQSVERLSFSKTSDYKPAPTSNGTITFIIKAN